MKKQCGVGGNVNPPQPILFEFVKTNTNSTEQLIPGRCLAREHQKYWKMASKEPPESCSSFLEGGDKAAGTFPDVVGLLPPSTLQGQSRVALLCMCRHIITLNAVLV